MGPTCLEMVKLDMAREYCILYKTENKRKENNKAMKSLTYMISESWV